MTVVPGWVPEDFACPQCGFDFSVCRVESVPERLAQQAAQIRRLIGGTAPHRLRERRAEPDRWTAVEYLCHVRDVFQASTIRLYRARTETTPRLEPLFNDQRAAWFRYRDRDVVAVLDELDAARSGCCDEIAQVADWERMVMRLPGETRTARWLARAAAHEAVHHRDDIADLVTPA